MRRKYSTSTTTSQSCTRWVQPIDLRVPPTWTGPTPSSSRFGPVQNSSRRGETDQLCTVKVPTTPWSTTVVNLGAIRRDDVPLGRTDARVRWIWSASISRFRGWRNGDGRRTEKRGRGCYRSSAQSTERHRKQNAGPGRWRTVGERGANHDRDGGFNQTTTGGTRGKSP